MSRSKASFLAGTILLLVLLAWPAVAHASLIELVSVNSAEVQAGGTCGDACISADGRYVAFASTATNLVANDTNGSYDIFVRDRQSGDTARVSVATNGSQGNGASHNPSISADGRYVAFMSLATNLVDDDTNEKWDVFVHDRQLGTTIRVSVAGNGDQANGESRLPSISANGRHVAFESDATNLVTGDTKGFTDVFVYELLTLVTERVSLTEDGQEATGHSGDPSISADGNLVAFESTAADLVSEDTNSCSDIFIRDRQGLATERVNLAASGLESEDAGLDPSISGDGRYVAFRSSAADLVLGDTNGYTDVFVRDRQTNVTELVSVSTDGAQGNNGSYSPAISADGSHVAFESYVAFESGDTNGTADVFVRRRASGTTAQLSVAATGALANEGSYRPAINDDGTQVVFDSSADNLVPSDNNHARDVFAVDTRPAPTIADLAPKSGPSAGGTSVVITGTDFIGLGGPVTDPDAVTFGGVNATTYTVDSATRIVAVAPPHAAATVNVQVVAVGGPSANTLADDYTYEPPTPYTSLRGSDRYDTAVKISNALYPAALPPGAGLVVATGETFQQALCGAPLAAAWGGPVLLTYQSALTNTTKTELQRLAPTQVFCIGLSSTAVTQVRSAAQAVLLTATVTAIDGANVYEMSRNVANQLAAKVGSGGKMATATAIITIGTNFPDAIGVAPLACAKLWPIILTDKAGGTPAPALHAQAQAALTDLGIVQAIKVGTYATLPGTVTGLTNCSGADRYYTNEKVAIWADTYAGLSFAHTAFATGDKFPDALASGPYLAKDGGLLLLSPLTGPVPTVIGTLLGAHAAQVQKVTFIACIEPVIGQVKALLP